MEQYILGALLARGTYGEVHLCVDRFTKIEYVMKRINVDALPFADQSAALKEVAEK